MPKQKRTQAAHVGGQAVLSLDLGELTPKQRAFCGSRALYTAYGGARGGGKTHAVRIKAVGGAIRWKNIRILIVRRTYPELQANHIEPLLRLVPREIAEYNATHRAMYFKNGSLIKFGHYGGTISEGEYQGQEYDWIFLDEATQFSQRDFRYLCGLLRGVSDIPKRFYLTCNPGGIGHRWVRRLFIDREFITGSRNSEEDENPDDYVFIPATVEDNTFLTRAAPGYVKMLAQLPENLRRAHRYGDWDALSGTYFPELSEKTHMLDAPFRIPEHWPRYRAIDYGLDMLACGWFAVGEGGQSFLYRELKTPGLIVSEAARRILELTLPGETVTATLAPPDLWNRQKDSGKTMAELFATAGVPLSRTDNSRVQGWLQVKEALAPRRDGPPALLFFPNCRETFSDMRAILSDPENPNDCAKEPHGVTHTCDMVRYFCITRTLSAEPAEAERSDLRGAYGSFMAGGAARDGYLSF